MSISSSLIVVNVSVQLMSSSGVKLAVLERSYLTADSGTLPATKGLLPTDVGDGECVRVALMGDVERSSDWGRRLVHGA